MAGYGITAFTNGPTYNNGGKYYTNTIQIYGKYTIVENTTVENTFQCINSLDTPKFQVKNSVKTSKFQVKIP